MSSRFQRPRDRTPVAPIHRGPQALPPGASAAQAPYGAYNIHAPNAALLIDFDNVTMGIQKDMQGELRNLMSSEIIKGKVSVQRAYADWRRYPGYIVPLTEASIDLIFAPAYGSAKKNATDIRLAIDAMELVFTRPEIGTFILLSGDSDFSSLVIKLKEYGKYVIGVGIRESSSDLLVQNCDEYYSYNALAGLVRAGDEELVRWDPWELVTEAIGRMARNGDVMRADRLKQVMQDIDPSFDEKDLGMSKFSRFVHEAEKRGLITSTRLDNGQYEIGPIGGGADTRPAPRRDEPRRDEPRRDEPRRPEPARDDVEVELPEAREEREARREERDRGRSRRGRRGRGRDFDRPARGTEGEAEDVGRDAEPSTPAVAAPPITLAAMTIGTGGERLTRSEAFDVVRRAVESLVASDDDSVPSERVRQRAFELLGRDSESLNARMFERILRDAHDADLVDLRRRGEAYEVSRAAQAESVADQLNRAAAAQTPAAAPTSPSSAAPRGMGPRGLARGRAGARPGAPPPDLLSVGVVRVDTPAAAVIEPAVASAPTSLPVEHSPAALEDGGPAATEPISAPSTEATTETTPRTPRGRGGRGRGGVRGAEKAAAPTPASPPTPPSTPPVPAPVVAAPSDPVPASVSGPTTGPTGAKPAGAGRGRRGRGGATKRAGAPAPASAPRAPSQPAAPAPQPAAKPPAKGAVKGPAKTAAKPAAKAASKTAPPAPAAAAAAPAAAPAGGRGGRGAKRPAARRGA